MCNFAVKCSRIKSLYDSEDLRVFLLRVQKYYKSTKYYRLSKKDINRTRSSIQ